MLKCRFRFTGGLRFYISHKLPDASLLSNHISRSKVLKLYTKSWALLSRAMPL